MNRRLRKGQRPARVHLCDCSAVAYRRDGSGWFCRECEVWLEKVRLVMAARALVLLREERPRVFEENYGRPTESGKGWVQRRD